MDEDIEYYEMKKKIKNELINMEFYMILIS